MIRKALHTAFLTLIFSLLIYAIEYNVEKSPRNLVKFISDAPMEDFEGTTSSIDGYIKWDGEDLTSKSDLYFEVDLRTLDTGIGLRNRHMRDNYLHTDRYPYASFRGRVIKADRKDNNSYNTTTEGKMTIHGVTKPVKIEGIMTYEKNGFRIKSSFSIKLTDYSIEVPKLMFMKISDKIDLVADFLITKKQ
ncbi:MAG: YceI family protein [Bacteroidota bacterium]